MKPLVGIIMGSDSDLPVMQEAAKVLEELGIASEVHTLSAHRTPEAVVEYVKASEAGGYKVFICGAGPISNKAAAGIDALFSTVQMPPGIPVATVAIDGAKNAGILAAQIVAAGDSNVLENIRTYKARMATDIKAKDDELQEKGFKKYLEDKGLL